MKGPILALALFVMGPSGAAENRRILQCRFENPEWTSEFTLDETGTGTLKFKNAKNPKEFTCALKLDYFNDGHRNVSPSVKAEFSLGRCPAGLGKLKNELLKNQVIIVDLAERTGPRCRVQWLTHKQPDTGIADELNLFEAHRYAKIWREGTRTLAGKKSGPK